MSVSMMVTPSALGDQSDDHPDPYQGVVARVDRLGDEHGMPPWTPESRS